MSTGHLIRDHYRTRFLSKLVEYCMIVLKCHNIPLMNLIGKCMNVNFTSTLLLECVTKPIILGFGCDFSNKTHKRIY